MTRRDDYMAAWPTAPTPAEVWHALIIAAATDDMTQLDACAWRAEMASIGPKWSDPTTDRRPVANITHRAEQGPRRSTTTTDPETAAWHTAITELRHAQLTGDHYSARAIGARLARHAHNGPTAALMGHDTAPECARLVDPLTATGDHTAAVVPCWAVNSTGEAHRSYVPDRPDTDAAFFRARGWQGADLVGERGNAGRHGARDRARDARLLAAAVKLVRTWQRGGPIPRVQGTGVLPSAPRVARETITLLLDRGGRDSDPAEAGRLAQRVLAGMRG